MSTFLGDFGRYMKTRTDAPPDFFVHAGMAALSVALGNRVYCDGWTRHIYPNVWIVLIAPSGYGKAAAPDMAVSLLRKANLGDFILPDSFSMEALLTTLEKTPVGLFELQEFAAFIGMLNRDYMSGTMPLLTKLYDCPDEEKRTLLKTTITITKPCLSILGASSPDWFADAFKQKDLRGGFYARFLFCPSSESGEYVGLPPPRNDRDEAPLAYHLKTAGQLRGKMDFGAVRAPMNEWDRAARLKARRDCPPEFAGSRSRAGALVLKAAMLFCASRDPETLIITRSDLDQAITYVEDTQTKAERFLTEEVAQNPDEADRIKIVDIVRRAGGRLQWSLALKGARLSAFKFKNAVETLKQSDRLWIAKGRTEQGGEADFLILGARSTGKREEFADVA